MTPLAKEFRWSPVTRVRSWDVAIGALLFAAVAAGVARAGGPFATCIAIAELTWLIGIAWWDAHTLRAPNLAVFSGLALALTVALSIGLATFWQSLAGAGCSFLVVAVVAVAGRGAMGAGDVKYAALAGAVVGIQAVVPMLVIAALSGGAIAALVLTLRLRDRKAVMAFTPLLALGAVASVAWFDSILAR